MTSMGTRRRRRPLFDDFVAALADLDATVTKWVGGSREKCWNVSSACSGVSALSSGTTATRHRRTSAPQST